MGMQRAQRRGVHCQCVGDGGEVCVVGAAGTTKEIMAAGTATTQNPTSGSYARYRMQG
jgi:hypothetical protein